MTMLRVRAAYTPLIVDHRSRRSVSVSGAHVCDSPDRDTLGFKLLHQGLPAALGAGVGAVVGAATGMKIWPIGIGAVVGWLLFGEACFSTAP
jgi:hypothetical protein